MTRYPHIARQSQYDAACATGRPLTPMALIPEHRLKSLDPPNARADTRLPHQKAA